MSWIFWATIVCAFGVLYPYVIYPIFLFFWASAAQLRTELRFLVDRQDRRHARRKGVPFISLVIAAHNEESVIAARIENFLSLNYPEDKLELLVGSDGSTDRTVEIAQELANERVRIVAFETNRGKASVLNDLVPQVRGEIVVFSDANSSFDSNTLWSLVGPMADPKVGAVCGELRLRGPDGSLLEEGIYWRFETALKILESRVDSVLGLNGAVYSLRPELWEPLPADTMVDDFHVGMRVREKGHRVLYEPSATAEEITFSAIDDEWRRRVRIGTGNFQSLFRLLGLLSPRLGFFAFSFLSHKIGRWLVPFWMIGFLAGSTAMAVLQPAWYWTVLVIGQLMLAALAWLSMRLRLRQPRGVALLAYFGVLNAALLLGFLRFIAGRAGGTWQRTSREEESIKNAPVEGGAPDGTEEGA